MERFLNRPPVMAAQGSTGPPSGITEIIWPSSMVIGVGVVEHLMHLFMGIPSR